MGSQTRKLAKLTPVKSRSEKKETTSTPGSALFLTLWDKVTNRLGPAGGLLLMIFVAVKSLAGDATEETIIQEIFFGKTSGKPYVGLFFAILVAFTLVDASLIYRYVRGERRELKRLRVENRRLQNKLLELQPNEKERAS